MFALLIQAATPSPAPAPYYSVELIKSLAPMAWPLIFLGLILILHKQIKSLLERSASVEIKLLGSEIKLTGKPSELENIKKIIEPILAQIDKNIVNLDDAEKHLFREINEAISSHKVHKLPPDFKRGSDLHKTYQRLRERHLIALDGKFDAGKVVNITAFGRTVLELRGSEIWPEDKVAP